MCTCPLVYSVKARQLCNINHSLTHFPPSHSHSSLSFTHCLCPSFSSCPSLTLSVLLANFHTTCPRQRRFADYRPFNAKHITRRQSCAQTYRHAHTHSQACSVTLAVLVWAHPAGSSLFVSLLMGEGELGLGPSVGSRSGRVESWRSLRLSSTAWRNFSKILENVKHHIKKKSYCGYLLSLYLSYCWQTPLSLMHFMW